MMSLKKLLKNEIASAFILFLILISCSKEERKDKNVIKINDSFLTESELDSMLNDKFNKAKHREELINDWVEDEILFNEAKKERILENKNFQEILNKSQKKLAIVFLINKILEEQNFQVKDDEIKKYFDENKNEFKLTDDYFHFVSVTFQNYDDAIKFRDKIVEYNKTIAENHLKASNINYTLTENKLYKYEIQPIHLLRILNLLEIGEVSTVIELDDQKFLVVQLMNKMEKDAIPNLEFVYNDIKARLLLIKKKEFINNYIKELISEHNIEIERFDE